MESHLRIESKEFLRLTVLVKNQIAFRKVRRGSLILTI